MAPRKIDRLRDAALLFGLAPLGLGLLGCASDRNCNISPPRTLGAGIDETFRIQEENAEAAKYVIYMHEFKLNESKPAGTNTGGWRLNEYGEEHVRQIAVNIKRGDSYPIVVARSQTSSREDTEFGFPIHYNDDLDARRRHVVVAALQALGVPDADERVVVATPTAEGLEGIQAIRAYNRSMGGQRSGGGTWGWGMGGSGSGGFGGGGMF
ncbi:MAG TPA: hypothetical protein PLV92_04885 [Pirellulaceae bacterium]|nr:hypothetical protein [Pirellulaceae bacterium]